jgi:uroporphyrinogen decarboxylase
MDAQDLKDRFGKDIVFWGGGCDSQHVLPFASGDEVKADVKKYVEIFKPGGGYVFNNVHNIQSGVPAENMVALFDSAYEYGFYE